MALGCQTGGRADERAALLIRRKYLVFAHHHHRRFAFALILALPSSLSNEERPME